MDNEVSENMKNIIRDDCKMELELVPPGCHRRNVAEVAIRNFKAHFLSVLAGVSADFPLNLWDRLLPQTEITLNLLGQLNATPTVSAYAHLSGPFDYNKMLLAPMGCGAQVHEKTDKRGTWSFHSVDGWYLYTSPEHYRTHVCQVKSTRSERLTDTVQFNHKSITNPTITHADKIMKAMADCINAWKGITNSDGSLEMRELEKLVETKAPTSTPTTSPTQPSPRVDQSVPRVDNETSEKRITRSMTINEARQQPLPRVQTAAPQQRAEEMHVTTQSASKKRKKRRR